MSRHLLTLYTEGDRKRARTYVNSAPLGTRVELKAAKRTLPQNSLMWELLTDISAQKEHNGRRYTPDRWKLIFLHALGQEVQFVPSLDGTTFIPIGPSSSDLSVKEMSDMIDLMYAWGAQNDIKFHGPHEAEKVA